MNALYISVPQKNEPGWSSFEDVMNSGISPDSIIFERDRAQLSAGCVVVLLDNLRSLRAEGEFVRLVPTMKADNGQQRYNIHFANARRVPYRSDGVRRQTGTIVKEYG